MLMKMLAKSVLSCEQMWMNLKKIFFHVVVHKSYSGLPPTFPHWTKNPQLLSNREDRLYHPVPHYTKRFELLKTTL
jgi:hypothetical protein